MDKKTNAVSSIKKISNRFRSYGQRNLQAVARLVGDNGDDFDDYLAEELEKLDDEEGDTVDDE